MKTRALGKSNLHLSEIGFGTWPLGGPNIYQGHSVGWRGIPEPEALALLQACPDLGINFIDTADIYGCGHAESLIGKAFAQLGERGRQMIIATKVGFVLDRDMPVGRNKDFSAAHLRRSCELSLQRLQRDCIDLYQLHNVTLDVIQDGKVFATLDALKKEGKIREYGVSIVRTDEALAALEFPGVRSIQLIFNIFRQKPIHVLFEKAKARGVGILARVPLASGLLAGKYRPGQEFPEGDHRREGIPGETFSGIKLERGLAAVAELQSLIRPGERSLAQAALQFPLAYDAVSATIPGSLSLTQLQENARTAQLPGLTTADLETCRQVYAKHFREEMEAKY